MKEFHLLTILVCGRYANTFIDTSVAKWVINNLGKDIVVLNSWQATEAEYLDFKQQAK